MNTKPTCESSGRLAHSLIYARKYGSVADSLLHKERKHMLTLTETATTVVKSIVERDPQVTDGALRIQPGDSERDFAVAVVGQGEPGDSLVESNGARIFLEPTAAEALGDKTLDAEVGESGAVTFALVPQL